MSHVKHAYLFLKSHMRTQAGRAWSFLFWSMIVFVSFVPIKSAFAYSTFYMPISSAGVIDGALPPFNNQNISLQISCVNSFNTTGASGQSVSGFIGIKDLETYFAYPATVPFGCGPATTTSQTVYYSYGYFDSSNGQYFGAFYRDSNGVWNSGSVPASTDTRIENLFPSVNSTTSAPVTLSFDYFVNSTDVISTISGGYYYDCLRITSVYGTVSTGLPTANTYTKCGHSFGDGTIGYATDTLTHIDLPLVDASSTYIGDVFVTVSLVSEADNSNSRLLCYLDCETWSFAINSYTLPNDSIFASSSFGGFGYSAAAVSAICNPATTTVSTLFINTNFSASQCLTLLFTPNADLIGMYVSNSKAALTTHFPIGYITDFVSILATTSSSSITVINATVPSGVVGGGSHISLNLNGSLNSILNATSSRYNNASASSTQTFYQITSYYWNLILYILCGFYIFRRILGSHMIPHFNNKDKKKTS